MFKMTFKKYFKNSLPFACGGDGFLPFGLRQKG